MPFVRSYIIRILALSFVLPGYLCLLSADRRADGSFARWLDLSLSSRFQEVSAPNLNLLVKSAESVQDALKDASAAIAAGTAENTLPADAEVLFGMLIGEWKQYRQVSASTTPADPAPELRDGKHHKRISLPGHTSGFFIPGNTVPGPQTGGSTTSYPDISAPQKAAIPPMASGMAMGAP